MKTSSISEFLSENLSRVTNRKYYIPEVDGLRFIAIFPVVLLHLSTWVQKSTEQTFAIEPLEDWLGFILGKGAFGVQLFFVLSGFILGLPFARNRMLDAKKVKLTDFYKRRLLRLEPPYIIVMVGAFFSQVLVLGKNPSELIRNLGASILYVHTWIFGKWSELNPVTWSLEVEVVFYLLAPFLAFLFFWKGNHMVRRAITILAILVITWLSVFCFPIIDGHGWSKTIFVELQYFLAGFLVADFFVNDTTGFFHKKSYVWDVLFLACLVGILYNGAYENVYHYTFPVYLVIMFFAAFKGPILNIAMRNKAITNIGGMCYTIYLIHYPLLAFITPYFANIKIAEHYWMNFLVIALIVLPILFIFSAIFFILIERPCMKSDWPHQLMSWMKSHLVGTKKISN